MAYLGNAERDIILPHNTRDDLVIGGNGNSLYSTSSIFLLSQEVPGGYEENVLVVKNGLILNPGGAYTIAGVGANYNREIHLALALVENDVCYVIHSGSATYAFVPSPASVTDQSLAPNLRDFTIDRFVGDGSATEFTLTKAPLSGAAIEVFVNGAIKENDFVAGDGTITQLDFRVAKVLHLVLSAAPSGTFSPGATLTGTAGHAPTARFYVDHVTNSPDLYVITTNDYAFTPGMTVTANKVGGGTLSGTLASSSFSSVVTDGILQFHSAPAGAAKVRVVHLGFSTVSRRALFSDNQVSSVPVGSVGSDQLATGAVTASKVAADAILNAAIGDNAVGGPEFRLANNVYLRALTTALADALLLKLSSSDNTILNAITGKLISLSINDSSCYQADTSSFRPSGTRDLGSSGQKFQDGYFSRNLSADGDLTVGGTINGVSNLTSAFTALQTLVSNTLGGLTGVGRLTQPGDVVMTASTILPSGWVWCAGQAYSQTDPTYVPLFNQIGHAFDTSSGMAAPGTGYFRVPNQAMRVAVGAGSLTGDLNLVSNPSPGAKTPGLPAMSLGMGYSGGRWDHQHRQAHTHATVTGTFTLPDHTHHCQWSINMDHRHRTSGHQHYYHHTHDVPGHAHDIHITATFDHHHAINIPTRINGRDGDSNRLTEGDTTGGAPGSNDTMAIDTSTALNSGGSPTTSCTVSGYVGNGSNADSPNVLTTGDGSNNGLGGTGSDFIFDSRYGWAWYSTGWISVDGAATPSDGTNGGAGGPFSACDNAGIFTISQYTQGASAATGSLSSGSASGQSSDITTTNGADATWNAQQTNPMYLTYYFRIKL